MSRLAFFQPYTEAYRKAKETVTDPAQFSVVAQWIMDHMSDRKPMDLDTFISEALSANSENKGVEA